MFITQDTAIQRMFYHTTLHVSRLTTEDFDLISNLQRKN